MFLLFFFFSSRRRHTRYWRDWSSDVCSSDLRIERNSVRAPPPENREVPPSSSTETCRKSLVWWPNHAKSRRRFGTRQVGPSSSVKGGRSRSIQIHRRGWHAPANCRSAKHSPPIARPASSYVRTTRPTLGSSRRDRSIADWQNS